VHTAVAAEGLSVSIPVYAEGLSVCIPVYNESNGIAETIRRCLACEPALRDAGVGALEVIVVDDGSQDDTAALVRDFPVRLIQHDRNRGYGAALKTGFSAARFDLVGFLDADATYPPEQFPALCGPVLDGRADLVIGSRMAGADSQMPATRRLGNYMFARLLRVIGRTDVSDTASGMRVFRKATLDLLSPLPDGLNLTPVMSTRAAHEAVRVVEVPIPYEERMGRSKLNVVRDGLRFFETIVWTAMTYNPVRVLGLVGLSGMALAVLVGVALLILRLQGVTTLGPAGTFAVFSAVVAGAAGASVFALGAAFNYFVSLFHHRPIRQGLLRKPLLTAPVEEYFLPSGLAAVVLGAALAVGSLLLSYRGWSMERLWLYLSGSAMLLLIGIQLFISWLQMSILRELSERNRTSEGI
jgi:glycosyltransferase involved in cell wall biosynthesis